MNVYAYVGNDPLDKTDPSGRCIEDLCIGETILAVEAVEAVVDAVEVAETAEGVTTAAEGATQATEAVSGTESASATEARTATEAARPSEAWKPGDDVRAPTRQGNSPSDRTITRREWKKRGTEPIAIRFYEGGYGQNGEGTAAAEAQSEESAKWGCRINGTLP